MRTLENILLLALFIMVWLAVSPIYYTMKLIQYIKGKDCDDE